MNLKQLPTEIKRWIYSHKGEFVLLLVVISICAFIRLYRISDYMTFLGDEGRDVIIVRRFLEKGDIMLIGPGTSIGNMYLGPLYYYMMAPALLAAFYSPVGPAVMIALLSVITTLFIWYVTRVWFGSKAAVIASAIYSIAPTIIIYSRSSWNPNIMPFFALLSIWSIWKVWNDKKFYWLSGVGFSIAACLQSHYLALLLVPVLGIFWVFTFVSIWKSNLKRGFIIHTILMLVVFLLLMSPLFIFDIRHNFMNFNAIKVFFTERQTTVSIKPWKALPALIPQLTFITERLVTGYSSDVAKWGSILLVGGILTAFRSSKFRFTNTKSRSILLLATWLLCGLLGLSLYKQQIYDHYYGFLFPVFFILTGATLSFIWDWKWLLGRWISLALFIVLVWINLMNSPLKFAPNMQYPRSVAVSNFITKSSEGKNFNFAVIAERNYEGAYQYFLEKSKNFRVIDPQNTRETITDQLFVVCEMDKTKCDPTHNAKTEIAAFGWSKIENTWNESGVIIYKLVHNYPEQPSQKK